MRTLYKFEVSSNLGPTVPSHIEPIHATTAQKETGDISGGITNKLTSEERLNQLYPDIGTDAIKALAELARKNNIPIGSGDLSPETKEFIEENLPKLEKENQYKVLDDSPATKYLRELLKKEKEIESEEVTPTVGGNTPSPKIDTPKLDFSSYRPTLVPMDELIRDMNAGLEIMSGQ